MRDLGSTSDSSPISHLTLLSVMTELIFPTKLAGWGTGVRVKTIFWKKKLRYFFYTCLWTEIQSCYLSATYQCISFKIIYSTYTGTHTSYLSSSLWFISHSIVHSRSNHVVTNGKNSFYLELRNIPLCIYLYTFYWVTNRICLLGTKYLIFMWRLSKT